MNRSHENTHSQFFFWNIFRKSGPVWQAHLQIWMRKEQFEPWKSVQHDGLTVCQLHICRCFTSLKLSANHWGTPTSGSSIPSSLLQTCREPERARVRQITPPGHIYVIIMTRVNRSIIKKPCLLFPSGRKWISVSASQRDSPEERQNWRYQLLGALHVFEIDPQVMI